MSFPVPRHLVEYSRALLRGETDPAPAEPTTVDQRLRRALSERNLEHEAKIKQATSTGGNGPGSGQGAQDYSRGAGETE
ncbi:MAG: hypothetical protein GEV09_12715 [Pseudonocardiaceae bacterium]|nr:hypothetical protein [Pseudonocardiaceae bacterium]